MDERSGAGGAGAPPLPGEAATPGEADGPTSWESGRTVNAPLMVGAASLEAAGESDEPSTGRITAKPARRRGPFPVVLNISLAERPPLPSLFGV